MGSVIGGRPSPNAADLAALALIAATLAPGRMVRGGPNVCLVRRLTGLPCPTCGLTRSWHAASRFEIRRSLGYHPLGPPTFLLALALATHDERQPPPAWLHSPVAAGALAAAWMAVAIYRSRRAFVARSTGR